MSAMTSMRRSRLLLEAFLEREHKGEPLDRPVMEYLAGAVADAADDASCNADIDESAAVVSEMTAEYLFPPQSGNSIVEDIARMIRAVRAPAAPVIPVPHQQQQQQHQQQQQQQHGRLGGEEAEPSMSAGATEFKPRAAAAAFVPGAAAAAPSGGSDLLPRAPPGFSNASSAADNGGASASAAAAAAAAASFSAEAPPFESAAPGSWMQWGADGSWQQQDQQGDGSAELFYYGDGYWEEEEEDDDGVGWEQAVADLPETEAMELLVMQFPHYSLEQLQSLLAAYGGNVAVTMDVLLQLEGDCTRQFQQQQQQAASEKPEEAVPAEPPVIDDVESFPTLGSSPAAAASSGASPGWGPAVDFAAALKKKAAPPPSVAPLPKTASRGGSGTFGAPGWSGSAVSGPSASVKWVETGAAVDSMYRDARGDARDHARIRNMYFQQATQAYVAGNRALAKELGAKGRAAGAAMKEAHAHASSQIFQSRNRNTGEEGMVDLHGLHTKEAIALLGSELERYKQQGRMQVFVLVGTGHHTKTHRSTLPEAVENFLKERMVSFRVAQSGLLELRLC